MSVQETSTELWGGETTKAVANFPVSGERAPLPVVRWLGRIKGTAARVNAAVAGTPVSTSTAPPSGVRTTYRFTNTVVR